MKTTDNKKVPGPPKKILMNYPLITLLFFPQLLS